MIPGTLVGKQDKGGKVNNRWITECVSCFGAWGPIQLKTFRETIELTLEACLKEPVNSGIYSLILFPYD